MECPVAPLGNVEQPLLNMIVVVVVVVFIAVSLVWVVWRLVKLCNVHLSVCRRFRKGFESEPTLHSGINYAVLLLAAGHQFDTSFELRKVGEWKFSLSMDQLLSLYYFTKAQMAPSHYNYYSKK